MDILRLLPDDEYQAAVGANAPTALNPFATIADLVPDTDTNIYNTNGTIGSGRIATITDTLTFSGGTNISTLTATTDTITSGVGLNPIGFGAFGDLNLMTLPGQFDSFSGLYKFGAFPRIQNQIYDNSFTGELAETYVGVADFSGTDRPYAGLEYIGPGNVLTGFEANRNGERILSQSAGLNRLSTLPAASGMAFLSGTGGTGYVGCVDQAGLINWMGALWPSSPAITDDLIPRGDGTTIEDGTWSNVGNDILPVTTGSNIGSASNRIGTMYMSSVIDYATTLNLANAGTNRLVIEDDGKFAIGTGQAATTTGSAAQNLWSTSFSYGLSVRGTNNSTASMLVQPYGTTPWGLYGLVDNNNTKGGETIGIYGRNITTAGSVNIGLRGTAANGSAQAIGVDGEITNNSSIVSSTYTAAVRGRNAGDENTLKYGGYFQSYWQNVGTVYTNDTVAVRGEGIGTTGSANSTGTIFGGWFSAARVTGTGTAIGLRAGATLGTTNIAIQVLANQGDIVLGTTTPLANTKLTVRGSGTTSATNTVAFAGSTGVNHFLMNDAGQVGTRAGGGASINASFGQFHQSTGYAFGFGFYPNGATSAGVTIQMQGTTRNGLTVATQNSPVGGTVKSIAANTLGNASAINVGIEGQARNGSTYSVGIQGIAGGGATVTPSSYVAAVAGNAGTNVDALQYGGYFVSNSAFAGVKTKDIIAVFGSAGNSTIASGSTSKAIGGQFRTSTIGGGGGAGVNGNMALNVPASLNDGNSVFNADASSANASTVEVHNGDIEIINSANGLILEAPDTTRYRVTVNNAGALVIAAA